MWDGEGEMTREDDEVQNASACTTCDGEGERMRGARGWLPPLPPGSSCCSRVSRGGPAAPSMSASVRGMPTRSALMRYAAAATPSPLLAETWKLQGRVAGS